MASGAMKKKIIDKCFENPNGDEHLNKMMLFNRIIIINKSTANMDGIPFVSIQFIKSFKSFNLLFPYVFDWQ